ncbi:MAG: response regulator [Microvirga sp.]
MSHQRLVLLVAGDRLAGRFAKEGLEGFGYEVLTAWSVEEGLAVLRERRRIDVLVVDVKAEDSANGLGLARAARAADPSIRVIYTCGIPNRLPEREKVSGAPSLRTPYHPHQLVSVIGQITQRAEAHAA